VLLIKLSYRVGDLVFVIAVVGAFQRQVPGQPELGLVRGLANELEKFGLGTRPIGTAVVQQFSAEFQCGFRRLHTT